MSRRNDQRIPIAHLKTFSPLQSAKNSGWMERSGGEFEPRLHVFYRGRMRQSKLTLCGSGYVVELASDLHRPTPILIQQYFAGSFSLLLFLWTIAKGVEKNVGVNECFRVHASLRAKVLRLRQSSWLR